MRLPYLLRTNSQIRLMIGAGLLVARGVVPPDTVAIALQLPYKLNFPLVPAEGLFLRYAGFAFSGNKVWHFLLNYNSEHCVQWTREHMLCWFSYNGIYVGNVSVYIKTEVLLY
jgi:hypothetical protein